MSVLAKKEIICRIQDGDLVITPYDENQVEPASYDCKLGEILAAGIGKVDWGKSGDFTLESNSWASVSSEEEIRIPTDVCASYGIRSGLARRGVIAFGGPQIDPGYSGKIYVSLYNPTLEPIVLRRGQNLLSVIFYSLSSKDGLAYSGKYQGQNDFPSQDVEFMMRMKSRNLATVIDNVEILDRSVNDLSKNLKMLTSDVHEIRKLVDNAKPWLKVIAWILGIAGAAVVGWVVVELMNSFIGKPPPQ